MSLPIAVAALKTPVAVTELLATVSKYAEVHPGSTWRQVGEFIVIFTAGDPCPGCIRCEEFELESLTRLTGDPLFSVGRRMFIVCPDCGNKRCPRASDHDFDCSGSNEPGQLGSVYGASP